MEEDHKSGIRQPDQITVKDGILKVKAFNQYLFSRWKLIVVVVIFGAVIGFLYATFKKTVYTAEFTFVLDDGTSSGGGMASQYSALASMAGIDIGGSTGLFEGDNIIELYKSRLMLQKTLLTKVSFNGQPQLLIDRYIQINDLRKNWSYNPALNHISFDTTKGKFDVTQDSIIIMIANDINKKYLSVDKPDKKLSIISVKVNSKDPLFAKAFAETIVANVNNFYIDTKTKSSARNMILFQRQVDSIRRVLNSSISSSASAMDANPDPNPVMSSIRVPSQKKQVDIQANSALYAEAVKNLEVARSMLQRETPLIQVIDQPMLPLANDKISRSKGMLTGALIALFTAVVLISINKFYRTILS